MRLKDKRVVITAAASGMGRAGCEIFAQEGATVFAVDIDETRLNEVVEAIKKTGAEAYGQVADLLDPETCRRVVDVAALRMGGLDIVWNHAGIPGLREVEDLDLVAYAKTMDMNVRTGLVMTGAAIPHFRKRGGGSLVFTASMVGLVGSPSSVTYTASKFAVVGMVKSLALCYAAENIRVNAICPGAIETPMLPQFFDPKAGKEAAEQARARAVAAIPMGRVGKAFEAARAALWLASDEASYITGVALPVDGGFTAR